LSVLIFCGYFLNFTYLICVVSMSVVSYLFSARIVILP